MTPSRPLDLRAHVLALLAGGQAHTTFEDAVADFPIMLRGAVPDGSPYSAWQLVEHLRIAQDDIVRFSQNDDGAYTSPDWPSGYWPKSPSPPSVYDWDQTVSGYLRDRGILEAMVRGPRDLLTPFPWGDGQTLLRQALLAADHSAYHIGQLVLVRRLLGAWPD